MSIQKRIDYSNRFLKDVARSKRRGMDMEKLDSIIRLLGSNQTLPQRNHPHRLNNWDCWECHVEPDCLLVYEIRDDAVVLRQLGTHSDIFG